MWLKTPESLINLDHFVTIGVDHLIKEDAYRLIAQRPDNGNVLTILRFRGSDAEREAATELEHIYDGMKKGLELVEVEAKSAVHVEHVRGLR